MANTYSTTLVAASSQYFSRAANTAFDAANYTIECWIKRASTGTTQVVSGEGGGTAGWALFFTTGNLISLTHQGIGTVSAVTAITNTTTWYHVAATYDGTTAKIYINGTQDNSGALSAFSTPGIAMKIGANEATPTNFFDGKIDEVRYWNVVRTGTQINDNKSISIDSAANLVASWHLNNALDDSSGNGYTLTNNNSATFTTDIPYTDGTTTSTSSRKFTGAMLMGIGA